MSKCRNISDCRQLIPTYKSQQLSLIVGKSYLSHKDAARKAVRSLYEIIHFQEKQCCVQEKLQWGGLSIWLPDPSAHINGLRNGTRLNKPHLDQVVQKNDNVIHRINHYSATRVVCFLKTNPLESDVSVDGVMKALNNREQAYNNFVKERLKQYQPFHRAKKFLQISFKTSNEYYARSFACRNYFEPIICKRIERERALAWPRGILGTSHLTSVHCHFLLTLCIAHANSTSTLSFLLFLATRKLLNFTIMTVPKQLTIVFKVLLLFYFNGRLGVNFGHFPFFMLVKPFACFQTVKDQVRVCKL